MQIDWSPVDLPHNAQVMWSFEDLFVVLGEQDVKPPAEMQVTWDAATPMSSPVLATRIIYEVSHSIRKVDMAREDSDH